MKTLQEIYSSHTSPEGHGDKGTAHSYIDVYAELLESYRDNSNILEIGMYYGQSLEMWEKYFTNSNIYGIDIHDRIPSHVKKNCDFTPIIGDATNSDILNKLPNDMTFDVIIDDGSHRLNDQVMTFEIFKSRMKPGGIYIIEDIQNLDRDKKIFLGLHENVEIIDRRSVKGRYDDILIVYKF